MTCPVRLLVLPLPFPTANVILRVCKFCFSSTAHRPLSLETLTGNTEASQLSQNLYWPCQSKPGINGKLQVSCSDFQSKDRVKHCLIKVENWRQPSVNRVMLQLQNEPLKKPKKVRKSKTAAKRRVCSPQWLVSESVCLWRTFHSASTRRHLTGTGSANLLTQPYPELLTAASSSSEISKHKKLNYSWEISWQSATWMKWKRSSSRKQFPQHWEEIKKHL